VSGPVAVVVDPVRTTTPVGAPGTVAGTTAADATDTVPAPTSFVAVTVHVYDFPFVNPDTVIGDAAPDADPAAPPFDDVHDTPKPVIADPPLLTGAVNATDNDPFPRVATTPVGAPGTVAGTTAADATDTVPAPTSFVAVTVHVYDFPFVNPDTVTGDDPPDADPAAPPFDDTHDTPKAVIALPPSLAGATNPTLNDPFPRVATTPVGAPGTVAGTTAADATDTVPAPTSLVAVTVHVYDFPFVNPDTTTGDEPPEAEPDAPPFDEVHDTEYEVIALPPSLAGATNPTLNDPFPRVATTPVGAPGVVAGITAADATDTVPAPTSLVAVTVHVYDFPFVNPDTVTGDAAPDPVPDTPPFDDVHDTPKLVIADPPSLAGGVNATDNDPFPRVATTPVGAPGTVAGTTAADATDTVPAPTSFVAVTVHVYDFPFVNPDTTSGDDAPDADPAAPPFEDAHDTPKPVIADPPSLAGGVNATDNDPFPRVATTPVGAPGRVAGTTAADATDTVPAPTSLVAVTVHVYDFPFVNPDTTSGDDAPDADPAAPPFDDVHDTPNAVIADPPLLAGATNATDNDPFPRVATTPVGAPGVVAGTTAADATEAAPVPIELVAVAVHVYDFPFVNPDTTSGDDPPDADPAAPPFDEVHDTPKLVIALPPSLAGGVNPTLSDPLPRVAVTPVGGSGGVRIAFVNVQSTWAPAVNTIVAVRVDVFPEPPVEQVSPASRQPATAASVTE